MKDLVGITERGDAALNEGWLNGTIGATYL